MKEKKSLEERLNEMVGQLGSEEERSKQLAKIKSKYEAIIAELEERLKKEQEVSEILTTCLNHWLYLFQSAL